MGCPESVCWFQPDQPPKLTRASVAPRRPAAHLSDAPVLTLPVRPRADSVSSLWVPCPTLPRLMSMDSLLVCMLLTEGKPMLPPPLWPPSVPSRLWAEELLKVVPQVRLLEGPVEE